MQSCSVSQYPQAPITVTVIIQMFCTNRISNLSPSPLYAPHTHVALLDSCQLSCLSSPYPTLHSPQKTLNAFSSCFTASPIKQPAEGCTQVSITEKSDAARVGFIRVLQSSSVPAAHNIAGCGFGYLEVLFKLLKRVRDALHLAKICDRESSRALRSLAAIASALRALGGRLRAELKNTSFFEYLTSCKISEDKIHVKIYVLKSNEFCSGCFGVLAGIA
ncbi:hypothetical protein K469DRAFT_710860 [Zopfia rhizophila CBS 207.26]|uniref:Uncharacterized protein n=1 Tax=Zopfia rhizophila CBS 207.26 TaxID=1314779 RepID=A0A6A6DY92_9PEZI|nr:hypothetical protein K469DRAFT_710860 [Zopfia rhizophila CBS 207.26]